MTATDARIAAGVDAGTECVKAVILSDAGQVLGRAVVPTRGYFQACAYEALAAALDDAQRKSDELAGIGATGFAMRCVPDATTTASEAMCHALGAHHYFPEPMTLLSAGGREPIVIFVDTDGTRIAARGVRRCAIGIGSFLMFAARHLDVSPARLQELAAQADQPARVSSYCSVFSATEVLERLREGATREEVALGCMHSIAERMIEIGGFVEPIIVCGGVAEYFPGVIRAFEALSGKHVRIAREPLFTGALGAAINVFRKSAEAPVAANGMLA